MENELFLDEWVQENSNFVIIEYPNDNKIVNPCIYTPYMYNNKIKGDNNEKIEFESCV